MNLKEISVLTFGILICLALSVCDQVKSKMPVGQVAFTQQIDALVGELETASEGTNSLVEDEVEERAIKYLRKTPHEAVSWVASVESVSSSSKKIKITTIIASHTYYLKVYPSDAAIEFSLTLAEGDIVVFSGSIGAEDSFTIKGGLEDPEFIFYPKSIKKYGESSSIVQDLANSKSELVDG